MNKQGVSRAVGLTIYLDLYLLTHVATQLITVFVVLFSRRRPQPLAAFRGASGFALGGLPLFASGVLDAALPSLEAVHYSIRSAMSSGSASGKIQTDAKDELEPADLKIILCGDSAVGKSKLVERFLLDDYCPRTLSTYALTLFRYNHVAEDGRTWIIDFWDTAGQEQFDRLHASYYFQANACILAFDVTRKVTYKNLDTWYKELRVYCAAPYVTSVTSQVYLHLGKDTYTPLTALDVGCAHMRTAFDSAGLAAAMVDGVQLPPQTALGSASKHTVMNIAGGFSQLIAASCDGCGTNVVRVFKECIGLAVKNKEQPPDEAVKSDLPVDIHQQLQHQKQ
ncbi:unnamed protein product [Polarella glacialis]|uniref:Uncharacterized protein n=1 Tax=Polarella glacialis TaxID=89957 RepID=A0A813L6G0_POLGL|nr:unnamed protein product [Polarella glacialis]